MLTKEFISMSGRGVKAKIEDKMYFAGNIAFIKENNIPLIRIPYWAIDDLKIDDLLLTSKFLLKGEIE